MACNTEARVGERRCWRVERRTPELDFGFLWMGGSHHEWNGVHSRKRAVNKSRPAVYFMLVPPHWSWWKWLIIQLPPNYLSFTISYRTDYEMYTNCAAESENSKKAPPKPRIEQSLTTVYTEFLENKRGWPTNNIKQTRFAKKYN